MTETDPRGTGIYGRQSHGKATSVEDQIRAGHKRCDMLNRPVSAVYRDKVSVSRFSSQEREDWPRLVSDVQGGRLGLVWLWDASRGDRTPESWFQFLSACRNQRVELYSERDEYAYRPWIPRDWKTLAEAGVDAAYESEIKSVDVRRGIAGAAFAGKPHGPVRDGYDRVYNPANRNQFTDIKNDRAWIAEEIITRIAQRDPISTIQLDLTRRGIPTASWQGVPWVLDPWHRNTIRAIARNPGYAGLRRHNDGTCDVHRLPGNRSDDGCTCALLPGNWEAAVDREVWEKARSVLMEPDRKSSAPGALKYLLSYLMVGPHGDLQTNPGKDGRSPRYRCIQDGCTTIRMWEADEYVVRVILARLSRADARELFTKTSNEELAKARADVAAIEGEARELDKAARAGMRPALAATLDASIQERLREARARAQALSGNAEAMAFMESGNFTAKTARPRWDALSVAARRSIIGVLMKRIELSASDVKLSRWATPEQRLDLAKDRITITWQKTS